MITKEQATVNTEVLYAPWVCSGRRARYGVILQGPNEEGFVHVRLQHVEILAPLHHLIRAPRPFRDEHDLIKAIEKEMKFVEDEYLIGDAAARLALIAKFETMYGSTEQDTVTYGPEFVIVVRNILNGRRPVKLRFLTDFDGEEK